MDKRIIKAVIQKKLMLIVLVVCCTVVCLLQLSIPYFLQLIVDSVVSSNEYSRIQNYVYCFIGIIVISIVPNYITYVYSAKLVNDISKNIYDIIVDKLENCSLSFFEGKNIVEIAKQIENDTVELVNFVVCNISMILSCVINFLGVLYLVWQISFKWILMFLMIAVLYSTIMQLIKEKLRYLYVECKDRSNSFFSFLCKIIENVQSIRIHCVGEYFGKIYDNKYHDLTKANIRRANASFFFANSRLFLELFFYVLLFTEGIKDIYACRMTIGQFVALNGLFGILINTFSYFINLSNDLQNIIVSSERLKKLIDLKEDSNGTIYSDDVSVINVNNVRISLSDCVRELSVNEIFVKGCIYCIVGDNGIGKTTFLMTIMGLREKFDGEIYYDNVRIQNYDMKKVRENQISFFEQVPLILDDSIGNNLCFGKRDLLKNCGDICNFVSYGLHDWNRVISSAEISGGERHRIGIMRALIKKSSVLIMDEPTAGLDQNGIAELKKYLKLIKKNKIILIVSHDKNMIDIADKIVNLQ